MDVTRSTVGPGLTEAQLARLAALERSTALTGFQVGEAAFLATQATGEQRERALQVAQRKAKK